MKATITVFVLLAACVGSAASRGMMKDAVLLEDKQYEQHLKPKYEDIYPANDTDLDGEVDTVRNDKYDGKVVDADEDDNTTDVDETETVYREYIKDDDNDTVTDDKRYERYHNDNNDNTLDEVKEDNANNNNNNNDEYRKGTDDTDVNDVKTAADARAATGRGRRANVVDEDRWDMKEDQQHVENAVANADKRTDEEEYERIKEQEEERVRAKDNTKGEAEEDAEVLSEKERADRELNREESEEGVDNNSTYYNNNYTNDTYNATYAEDLSEEADEVADMGTYKPELFEIETNVTVFSYNLSRTYRDALIGVVLSVFTIAVLAVLVLLAHSFQITHFYHTHPDKRHEDLHAPIHVV